ncbi:IclR family transcriptional regulator [Phytoactinopolyspora halotolerans]|uniref:IclR family transcriptional regulator n=1 Tax=Phytoactinopolyspora halotolerans TaxID=1981512 RepID=A0A6L9SGF9_9ACTN|nr:IclR family transcriptional regulator [Phytoactinopolyspora halotolerans]NEE04187.1 IclR family transcriptional regulator [Phytoactinopolyspora halotolerans]
MARQQVAEPGGEPQPESSPMPAVDKALATLAELAAAGPAGLSLGELATRLKLNKTSLHATLRALRHRDFVAQIPESGSYRLGPTSFELSRAYTRHLDIRAILRPRVLRLAEEIDEVCHISVLDGTEILYLEKMESRKPIQPGTYVGMRLSALTTAMGRAMIACEYTDYESFATRFSGALKPRTQNAPTTLPEAWERIVQARRDGYGLDLEENVIGLTAIGMAVLEPHGRPLGAVSIVVLTDEWHRTGPEYFYQRLYAALSDVVAPPLMLQQPMPD